MPTTSKKQHKFMEAVAHNPSFAKKVGVPQSVGQDFSNADKGKTFKRGGEMATKMDPKMMAMMMAKKKAAMGGGGARPPAPPMGGGMGMKKGGMAGGGMPMKDGKPAFVGDGIGKMKKGGMATGGVKMGNAGGYKMGGKTSKKAYATGGTVNSGKPVAMPQGAKKPTPPVSTNRVSGTFKKGGTVKMNGGGASSNKGIDMSKGAYDASSKHSRELEDAMNPLSMVKELAGKAKDYFMPKTADSVTKTKESVTVTPASKKRGGVAC